MLLQNKFVQLLVYAHRVNPLGSSKSEGFNVLVKVTTVQLFLVCFILLFVLFYFLVKLPPFFHEIRVAHNANATVHIFLI